MLTTLWCVVSASPAPFCNRLCRHSHASLCQCVGYAGGGAARGALFSACTLPNCFLVETWPAVHFCRGSDGNLYGGTEAMSSESSRLCLTCRGRRRWLHSPSCRCVNGCANELQVQWVLLHSDCSHHGRGVCFVVADSGVSWRGTGPVDRPRRHQGNPQGKTGIHHYNGTESIG